MKHMRQWLGAITLAGMTATAGLAADKGPEIQIIDNKLSIDAEAVPLSRLLRLLDLATGMQSKVPRELGGRNISVKFSGLDVSEGVRKLFQGQPLDYVVIEGQGIVVTAAAQTASSAEPVPVYTPPSPVDQPFTQDFVQPLQQPGNQQQPAMIQTPFGPMANPRAGQPPAPNVPLVIPGQQNPFVQGQQQLQPGQPNPPFGAASPFGTPMQGTAPQGTVPNSNPLNPANPSPLFSNPSPLGAPGTQQRTQ